MLLCHWVWNKKNIIEATLFHSRENILFFAYYGMVLFLLIQLLVKKEATFTKTLMSNNYYK